MIEMISPHFCRIDSEKENKLIFCVVLSKKTIYLFKSAEI